MLKYDSAFKLKIVKQYVSGHRGVKAVAHANGLTPSMVGRWIDAYRAHGVTGLSKKPQSYGLQFRLTVLRRMRQKQLSYSQTAALFDIRGASTVGRWDRRYPTLDEGAPLLQQRGRTTVRRKPPQDQKSTGAGADNERSRESLLDELKYLRAEVAFLKKVGASVQAKRATAQRKRMPSLN